MVNEYGAQESGANEEQNAAYQDGQPSSRADAGVSSWTTIGEICGNALRRQFRFDRNNRTWYEWREGTYWVHFTDRTHFRDIPGARVNGDTFIYYVEGDPRRSVSPDCYVVFGLTEAALHSLSLEGNNTYLLWEVGKAPDFILEIGSPSTAGADMGSKRDLYAGLGVREYWRFDATGGEFYGEPLVGERLVDGEYGRLVMRAEEDGRVGGTVMC